jgi:hypothetical protein
VFGQLPGALAAAGTDVSRAQTLKCVVDFNLATQYRQHTQRPLIVDSTRVKNVYGVDVIGGNHAGGGRNSTKPDVAAYVHLYREVYELALARNVELRFM